MVLGPGEADRGRVARTGRGVDRRPAGERQPEHPGHLVVGLPGGVVDGRPERHDTGREVAHQQQRRVPARHQQRDQRGGQRAVLQLVHGDVRGQVVHPVQRLAQGQRVGLGRARADQQRAGQPGPGGDRDRVHLRQRDPGRAQRAVHGGHHRLQVGPAGHLGHHAAEPGVLLDAGGHRVGQQLVAADQADPGLVAGRLDAEHQRRGHALAPVPRPVPVLLVPVLPVPVAVRSLRITRASVLDGW